MKHPVSKQKLAQSRTRKRYNTFATLARKKLINGTPIIPCPHCKTPKVNHSICKNCGYYGEKKIVNKSKVIEKVTKIKA